MINLLMKGVLYFFFPPVCGICGKIGTSYLCPNCQNQIQNATIFLNQIQDYRKDQTKYFDFHAYLFSYEAPIREKILQYKFEEQGYLVNLFSEFLVKNEKICGFLKNYDIITSVPMTKKKVKQRGYNQSQLLASKMVNKIPDLILEKQILVKYKENKTQSSLNKLQRLENVKNVYKVQNTAKIKEKKVLLFDDIYTTGATVNECAKVLKQAGAKEVGILTIAKDELVLSKKQERNEEKRWKI